MDKNNGSTQRPVCEQDEYYAEITELCKGITDAKFYPEYTEDLWRCACGCENPDGQDICNSCSASKERLRVIFSELFLAQKRYENEARKRAAEKLRVEQDAEKWRKIDPELEKIYTEAQSFEETRDNYLAAAKKLDSIKGYKDAESLAAEYRRLAETAPLYDKNTLAKKRGRIAKRISLAVVGILAVALTVYAILYFTLIAPGGIRYEINGDEVTVTSYDTFFGGRHANIPETLRGKRVTAIGNSAFAELSALKSVNIPSSVTSIGQNAFRGCSSLVSVTLPESVKEIGSSAFSGCTSLERVEILGDVKTLGIATFSECEELSGIYFAHAPKTVESTAFFGCGRLAIIKFAGSREEWKSIEIQQGNDFFENAAVVYNYTP